MIRLKSAIPSTRICNEFDRLLGGLVTGCGTLLEDSAASPAMNVWQDDTTVYVEAELPGVTMKDLEVLVLDDELTIKGQRRVNPEGVSYLMQECVSGDFVRVVKLPTAIDTESVSASLTNGMLKVTLPKAKQVLPRSIEVQS